MSTDVTAQNPAEDDWVEFDPEEGIEDGADLSDDDWAVGDDVTAVPGAALFDGDIGEMSLEQRTVLVRLLQRTYLSAAANPKEWQALLEGETTIRSRLNDLFLDLVVDRRYGVAYKQQVRSEGQRRFPTLLHRKVYTPEETILMVFLRMRFRSERANGAEVVFIDRDTLLTEIASFRPPQATNIARDARSAEKAVDSMTSYRVLLKTADPERLQVSPAIEVLLPLERVQELAQWLMTANGTDNAEVTEDHLGESTKDGEDND
jgi:hypothetical protein